MFKTIPTNTKLLVGILAAVVIFGGLSLAQTFSPGMAQEREFDRVSKRVDCEQRVKREFYGDYKSQEFHNAMRQCSL